MLRRVEPGAFAFEGGTNLEGRGVVESTTDDLQASRHVVVGKAARHVEYGAGAEDVENRSDQRVEVEVERLAAHLEAVAIVVVTGD